MEALHVRIDYDEAIDSKRDILNTQINLINMQKAIESYSDLRKDESVLKLGIKSKLNSALSKLNSFKKIMPKVHEKKEEKERINDMIEKPKTNSLEQELREIQKKLAKLE